MATKHIISPGIGFSPGSVKYIVTRGLITSAATTYYAYGTVNRPDRAATVNRYNRTGTTNRPNRTGGIVVSDRQGD